MTTDHVTATEATNDADTGTRPLPRLAGEPFTAWILRWLAAYDAKLATGYSVA